MAERSEAAHEEDAVEKEGWQREDELQNAAQEPGFMAAEPVRHGQSHHAAHADVHEEHEEHNGVNEASFHLSSLGGSGFRTARDSGSIFSAWIRALSAVAGFRNGCLDGLRELVGLRCVFGRHLHGVFEQVDGNIFYTVEPGYDFLNSGLTCSTAHAGDVEVHAADGICVLGGH